MMGCQAVAVELGNRTAEQCLHHYRDNLAAFKKGDWSPEEDAALLRVRARAPLARPSREDRIPWPCGEVLP